jgi:hypothetical protein
VNPVNLFFSWCRRQLPQSALTLRLFTALNSNDVIVPESFIEATFAGYRPAPDEIWVSRAADTTVARAFTGLMTWVTASPSAGQIVLGWYAVLTHQGNVYLIAYDRFTPPVDMSRVDMRKSCFALIELFSATARAGG